MSFAKNLKNLRELSGLTQDELAQKSGLKKSTISMYERGERFPSEVILEVLADIFNVDMNMLLGKQNGSTFYADPETAILANEIKSNSNIQDLLTDFRKLTPEGQNIVTSTAKGLASNPLYKAQPETEEAPPGASAASSA